MTLLEAPESPPRLPSNSLFADSDARVVRATTVEALFAVTPGGEPDTAGAWLLLTLAIVIMGLIATAGIRVIGQDSKNLREFCGAPINDACRFGS